MASSSGPANYPLAIYRGDTFRWRFTLWSDADKSVPVDLADAQVKAEIRNAPAGTTIVAMDCVVTTPNIIDMTLDASDSAETPNGLWDLQLTFPTGVQTVLRGKVSVTDDITDSS